MSYKMICLGAMALSMVSGVSLAAGADTGTSALDDPAKMEPFYTDTSMTTLRSDDEFTAAWKALTDEDRMAMTKVCADEAANANAANTHPEFCSNVKKLGGESN
ncbi:MAG: hypothetical protein EOR30_23545 [Mesorhizobium sp.]|uniref:hypothetical protein n=1 Tax=unclassified Mesorhizobium TaxID=325217 RepID=UPI000FCB5963|nr:MULTISPECIES: hypothetical protein [unclassified Mesorhizobium]RUV76819.1 hypothetical protein EOA78_01985 [Mesorhizobium sp. M5C.F.Cr.IN.023.01.1.1]RWF86297.1 MAG: hypothetical protein EOQ36_18120 [Mesorhizobium sp.]RWF91298.1 MAG: hypothetical protein EOQ45_26515 [Mesorhizobium sp.]RWI38186.1 MAG: hypothetical protein EOR14_23275 [Mesorhizobium sp.]RWI50752.1 MAG: hypothetical protein EOR15_04795 [Mesorhizobium sp.]